MAAKQSMRVRDNENVTEVYVNKPIGFMFDGSSFCITFGTVRSLPEKVGDGAPPPSVPTVHVTHRLAMPPSAAIELKGMLEAFIAAMSRPSDPKQAN